MAERSTPLKVFQEIARSKGGRCLSKKHELSGNKLLFSCKSGHKWHAWKTNIIKGHWCPNCAAVKRNDYKRDNIDVFRKIAKERGGKCLSTSYRSQKDRLLFECANKHQWYAPASHVKWGTWCRKCSFEVIAKKNRKITIQHLRDHAKNNGGKLISEIYNRITDKLLWECSEGHQWWTTAHNIRTGNWCKKCASKRTGDKLRYNINYCHKLAKERDGFCLSKHYYSNASNLQWKCSKGHIWESSYASIKRGSWCHICSKEISSRKRRLSVEFFKQYAISKGGICHGYLSEHNYLKFQCASGHIWNTKGPSMKNQNSWCPFCAGKYKAITKEQQKLRLNELIQIAKSKGGQCLSGKYINSKEKMKFKCSQGHIWETVSTVIKSGSWCKRCASVKANEWKKDSLEIFKKIIEKRGGKCLTNEYISQVKTRLLVECSKGHQWLTWPQHIKRGLWCRACNGSAKHSLADVVALAESRGGKCLSTNYVNDMTNIKWQCSEGHIWDATPNNTKKGKWCPTCNSGIGERACRLGFEKIFQKPFYKVRPSWLKNKRGFILELDGYNEELKIAFEHQGEQHYSNKTDHRFLKVNLAKNDKEKIKICRENRIALFHIPEVLTRTKLNNIIPLIIKQADKLKISYPDGASSLVLDPKEVYTYTRTKEWKKLEERAIAILKANKASLLEIYRFNSGVRIKIKCRSNHTSMSSVNLVINGKICKKCENQVNVSEPNIRL